MQVSHKKGRLRPEINVTPLVDVVLVLLIIFMVVAPQLDGGASIELPGVHNVAKNNQVDAVTVSVTATGDILVEKDPTVLADVRDRLATVLQIDPDKRLLLKADRRAHYGDVRRIFAIAQELGFRGVALSVEQKKEG